MEVLNGEQILNMIISGINNLENNKNLLNSLNVFPVPDGDTGTNMCLTMSKAGKDVVAGDHAKVTTIFDILANSSLRGARGNSGVILSQLIRGFAKAVKGKETINACDIALALLEGSSTAYKSIMKPTEGTILTVARETADYANEIANDYSSNLEEFLQLVYDKSKEVLARTPDMLPKLKQANVVDAGGYGLVILFEGALKFIKTGKVVAVSNEEEEEISFVLDNHEEVNFTYCTEFIIRKKSEKSEMHLKYLLEKLGDSLVFVEDEDIIKVHIHTNQPDSAMGVGLKAGELVNIKIDNMRAQNEELEQQKNAQNQNSEHKKYGFCAVALGDGMISLYKELGIDVIISGGQSMNPSTDDIYQAILAVNADNVIVFPNNSNIIMAARQAKELSDKNVIVIPTTSMPEVVNCIVSYNPEFEPFELEQAMTESLSMVKVGQVTYAVRDSVFDSKEIKKGDVMGMVGSKIQTIGSDIDDVTERLIKDLYDENASVITLYYGSDIKKEQSDTLLLKLKDEYPDCDVIAISGGQPVYYYLLSVE